MCSMTLLEIQFCPEFKKRRLCFLPIPTFLLLIQFLKSTQEEIT